MRRGVQTLIRNIGQIVSGDEILVALVVTDGGGGRIRGLAASPSMKSEERTASGEHAAEKIRGGLAVLGGAVVLNPLNRQVRQLELLAGEPRVARP